MLEGMKSATAAGNGSPLDRAAAKRLESLGYVGGPVRRLDFDPASEDPKDFGPLAARIGKANELNAGGQLDDAKKECLEIVALRPNLVPVHILLGEIASKQRRPDEAAQWLSRALSTLTAGRKKSSALPTAVENHEIAAIHGNQGIALLMQGKIEQAGVEFKAALALDPDSADNQYNLGNFYAASGRSDEALACYQKAVQIDPQYANAQYNLGTVLASSGRWEEAIPHFRQVLTIKPDYAEAHNNLGLALARWGRINEALAHFEKALEIKPDYAAARQNLETFGGKRPEPQGGAR